MAMPNDLTKKRPTVCEPGGHGDLFFAAAAGGGRQRPLRPARLRAGAPLVLVLLALAALAAPARAAREAPRRAAAGPVAAAALGAVGALLAHESGHLTMNAVLGNRPLWLPIRGLFGIPFLAISPNIHCHAGGCTGAQGQPFRAGERGRALIAGAGFSVQWLTSEIILTDNPRVLYEGEPLQKGWLAFNVALALGYAITCVAGIESDHGDATGLAAHARLSPAVASALVATPALLDAGRAVAPEQRWLAWAARMSKLAFVVLISTR